MSAIACPKCGEKIDLFGSGGGEDAARRLTELVGYPVDLIGQVPFDTALREGGDAGVPFISAPHEHESQRAIVELAKKLTLRSESLVGVPLRLT